MRFFKIDLQRSERVVALAFDGERLDIVSNGSDFFFKMERRNDPFGYFSHRIDGPADYYNEVGVDNCEKWWINGENQKIKGCDDE